MFKQLFLNFIPFIQEFKNVYTIFVTLTIFLVKRNNLKNN